MSMWKTAALGMFRVARGKIPGDVEKHEGTEIEPK